jgi:small GTP-binding protein
MIQKKICMLGAFAVGKTSLVKRYVESIYTDKYHTTVGVKIDKKQVSVGEQELNLLLWDIQGEDGVQKLRPAYLRGAAGYILVIDGTRRSTLDIACAIQKSAEELLGLVPFVVVINKSDLEEEWDLDETAIESLEGGGWTVYKTSAKTGLHVEEAFSTLAGKMMEA